MSEQELSLLKLPQGTTLYPMVAHRLALYEASILRGGYCIFLILSTLNTLSSYYFTRLLVCSHEHTSSGTKVRHPPHNCKFSEGLFLRTIMHSRPTNEARAVISSLNHCRARRRKRELSFLRLPFLGKDTMHFPHRN